MTETLLEAKCDGCWHWRAQGYLYCNCCLHGRCVSFSPEQKKQYHQERKQEKGERLECEARRRHGRTES